MVRKALLAATMLLAPLAANAAQAAPDTAPHALPNHVLMVYADSWRERAALAPQNTVLANVPGYVNLVVLSFAKPDMTYRGNLDLTETGLNYRFSGTLLRDAIALLKRRHPGTRVMISVGSGAFPNWDKMDTGAIARLVRDLGADGVDIDYEPDTTCTPDAAGHITCPTDAQFIAVTAALRRALPHPLLLSVAGWHVGAYGEGAFRDALPLHSGHAGFMLNLLRSPTGRTLDLVSIDAYDAGPTYDPMQAFHAYRSVWQGKLALGVEVPMHGAVGPFYTLDSTRDYARQVVRDPLGGMMVYSLSEPPDPPIATPVHPDGPMLLQAACQGMGLAGCEVMAPMP